MLPGTLKTHVSAHRNSCEAHESGTVGRGAIEQDACRKQHGAGTNVLAATRLHGECRGLELAVDFNDCGDAMAIDLVAKRDKVHKASSHI